MAVEIGNVQSVSRKFGEVSAWGFTLKDSTAQPARFVTITYRTQAEAECARELIKNATVGAIDAYISP